MNLSDTEAFLDNILYNDKGYMDAIKSDEEEDDDLEIYLNDGTKIGNDEIRTNVAQSERPESQNSRKPRPNFSDDSKKPVQSSTRNNSRSYCYFTCLCLCSYFCILAVAVIVVMAVSIESVSHPYPFISDFKEITNKVPKLD